MLLLLALEGLDLAPARHPRGVDGVQRAVAERREVVRQAALLDLLVDCILEVRERLLPEACVVGARDSPEARVTVQRENLADDPPADRRLKNPPGLVPATASARGLNSRWRRRAKPSSAPAP